jgi:hypothetical protein
MRRNKRLNAADIEVLEVAAGETHTSLIGKDDVRVSHIFASWNQIVIWLQGIHGLRCVA